MRRVSVDFFRSSWTSFRLAGRSVADSVATATISGVVTRVCVPIVIIAVSISGVPVSGIPVSGVPVSGVPVCGVSVSVASVSGSSVCGVVCGVAISATVAGICVGVSVKVDTSLAADRSISVVTARVAITSVSGAVAAVSIVTVTSVAGEEAGGGDGGARAVTGHPLGHPLGWGSLLGRSGGGGSGRHHQRHLWDTRRTNQGISSETQPQRPGQFSDRHFLSSFLFLLFRSEVEKIIVNRCHYREFQAHCVSVLIDSWVGGEGRGEGQEAAKRCLPSYSNRTIDGVGVTRRRFK